MTKYSVRKNRFIFFPPNVCFHHKLEPCRDQQNRRAMMFFFPDGRCGCLRNISLFIYIYILLFINLHLDIGLQKTLYICMYAYWCIYSLGFIFFYTLTYSSQHLNDLLIALLCKNSFIKNWNVNSSPPKKRSVWVLIIHRHHIFIHEKTPPRLCSHEMPLNNVIHCLSNYKVGPLLVINGVITPFNGLINE